MIFQPSVVFGPHDAFVNQFAAILKITPGVLPLACADARFAPVYVGDVAEAFVRCLDRNDVAGRTFQLYGPETITLGDIVRLTARTLGLRRWVLPLPRAVARLQAALMDYVPGKPFSTDNFRSASVASVGERDGLAELGIARTPLRGTDRDVSAEIGQPSPGVPPTSPATGEGTSPLPLAGEVRAARVRASHLRHNFSCRSIALDLPNAAARS